jgi:hypothetical protein
MGRILFRVLDEAVLCAVLITPFAHEHPIVHLVTRHCALHELLIVDLEGKKELVFLGIRRGDPACKGASGLAAAAVAVLLLFVFLILLVLLDDFLLPRSICFLLLSSPLSPLPQVEFQTRRLPLSPDQTAPLLAGRGPPPPRSLLPLYIRSLLPL